MMKCPPPRFKAFCIHLAFSALFGLSATLLIYWVWYPGATADLLGVGSIALLLITVDVIVGPALTAVIFNPEKPTKELGIDLGIIACLQAAALIYGVSTIFAGRPLYIVFNIDRFTVVTQSELDSASWKRAQQLDIPMPSYWKPRIVAATLPNTPEQHNEVLFSALEKGIDLPLLSEWYVPIEGERASVIEKARPIQELKESNNMNEKQWKALSSKFGATSIRMGYLPLLAPPNEGVAIVDLKSGNLIKLLNIAPRWQISGPHKN